MVRRNDESADFTDNQINALVRVDEFWELSVQRFGIQDFHKPVIAGQELCRSCCTLSQMLHNLLHICLQILAF